MVGFSALHGSSYIGSACLVFLYAFLASCRVLLIRNLSENRSYKFLPMTVNVQSELLKFIVCSSVSLRLIIKEEVPKPEITRQSLLKSTKWAIPGFFYFLDNLLSFYVLARLSPAVASLLNNFVIITTAFLFRLVLRRKLTLSQWASLGILFCAIVALSHQSKVDSVHHHSSHSISHSPDEHKVASSVHCHWQNVHNASDQNEESSLFRYEGHLFVLLSCFLSSMANIYNEKIFKESGGMEESIFLQNTKLYLAGLFFGITSILLIYHDFVFACGFYYGYSIYAGCLIFIVGLLGLVVSLILKFRDNMFHVLASQFSTLTIILLSWLSGDFEPTIEFFLMVPIVILSIYLYNVNRSQSEEDK